ncbi:MAG: hypothetical protein PVF27_08840, partial [Gemmatimonadales bacterium]
MSSAPADRGPARALAFCLLLTVACGDSQPSAGGAGTTSRRDSAGITIVSNSHAAWERSPVWQVADAPLAVINAAGGEDGQPLAQVRSATVLPDGRILVAEGGANQVFAFDASGQYLGSFDRGEVTLQRFGSLLGVWPFGGDSILVAEASGVTHVFTADGAFVRQLRPDPVFGPGAELVAARIRGVFADGRLLVSPWVIVPPEHEGPYRDTMYLNILDREGHVLRRLGRLLGREWYQVNDDLRRVKFVIPMPYPRETFVIAAGNHLYAVDNRRYEIQVRSTTGALQMLIRLDHRERAVSSEDIERYRERQWARAATVSDRMRRRVESALSDVLADLEGPDAFPPIRDVHATADGSVWVREYRPV